MQPVSPAGQGGPAVNGRNRTEATAVSFVSKLEQSAIGTRTGRTRRNRRAREAAAVESGRNRLATQGEGRVRDERHASRVRIFSWSCSARDACLGRRPRRRREKAP